MGTNVTIRLRLRPSDQDMLSLQETVRQYTGSFNRVCKAGWGKTTNGVALHVWTYKQERAGTQLPSQLAARVKATEALMSVRTLQKKRIARDIQAGRNPARAYRCPQSNGQAIRYDRRSSLVKLQEGYATLATVNGRVRVGFKIPEHFNNRTTWKVCMSDLVWKEDRLSLHVVLEGEGKPFVKSGEVVGVDMGICRPAVTSQNEFLGKREWRAIEDRRREYRRVLQRKGTKPARRKLRLLGGKVNRFRRDCDHVLSRQVVDAAPAGSVIVVEDLSGIRERQGRKRKDFRRRLHSWSFDRLRGFLEYKAALAGKKVVAVNPRNTSKGCSRCGHVEKANRKNQSLFKCQQCGFSLNADLNAARNIALRGKELAVAGMPATDGCQLNQPNVA